jgi:hypothetical protein
MLTALVIAVLGQTALGPSLWPGVRPEFSKTCIEIEELLEKGSFDEASKKLRLLPKKTVSVVWDDSKVPASLRATFAEHRDKALKQWTLNLGDVQFNFVPKGGDLRFSFEPKLAENPTSGLPAAAALFFSDSASDPRLDVVIGLNRGKPEAPIDELNLGNEVVHAVGAYFGLASTPFIGSGMGRSDLILRVPFDVQIPEFGIAQSNFRAAAVLRSAVEKKTSLTPARPTLVIEPKAIDKGTVGQGDKVTFNVSLSNTGNAPLAYRVTPDCGCMKTVNNKDRTIQTIQPGNTALVSISIDTTEFAGLLNKHLVVFSNDPEQGIVSLPVKVNASPRYRLLSTSPQTLVESEGGTSFDLFLVTPDDRPMKIVKAVVGGIPGTVTMTPWKGNLADPELNEPARPRAGTKLHVRLEESPIDGRAPITVAVQTNDPAFPQLYYNAFVQKGIVLLPDRVYMGELGKDVRKAKSLISRPDMPFKVLSVTSDTSSIDADVRPTRGEWEYQVTVTYNGKAPKGDLAATVTIKTNDPRQPLLRLSVAGIVR